jgi:homoserine kinase
MTVINKETVTVFAPATIANVGSGFDIFGLAINGIGDELALSFGNASNNTSLEIELEILGNAKLSCDSRKNCATAPMYEMLARLLSDDSVKISNRQKTLLEKCFRCGLKATLYKHMPLGSGLGSSGASACAGAFALNELLLKPFSRNDLVQFAMIGEEVACGSAHADNVAPCLLGGFSIVHQYEPLLISSLPIHQSLLDELYLGVVHPSIELETKSSRGVLPQDYPKKTLIEQCGAATQLIVALTTGDKELLKNSIRDYVAEPFRAPLIPLFNEAKKCALSNGAFGSSISGSGPSMFFFIDSHELAHSIARKIKDLYQSNAINSELYVSKINSTGCSLVS